MIDPFVLVAPVLLLAVIALLGFLGCNPVFGLEPTEPLQPPAITGISPNSATVCGPAFTLTVSGTNFDMASVVQWNGADRDTAFVSATELTAAIPAEDIADLAPGQGQKTVNVTVESSYGDTSNSQTFTVNFGVPDVADFSSLPPAVNNFDLVMEGHVPNIHFEGWIWYQHTPNQAAVYFDDPLATTRTFTFLNVSRIVQSMLVRHYEPTSPTDITISVTDDKGQSAPLSIKGGQYKTLVTGWVKCSQTVTITLAPATNNVGIVVLNTYLGVA